MPTIIDKEFGTVSVRKSSRSASMKASISPSGSLRISVPTYAPIFMVKRMINSMRSEIRELMDSRPKIVIEDGLSIGKSHSMIVRAGQTESASVKGLRLVVTIIPGMPPGDTLIAAVRAKTIVILRKEAKAHLPKRIHFLASKHGYEYSSLRFTHASSRWGSCNNKRAISLNIALMNLPFELIDYVLLHELAHTVHMNHSNSFWEAVAQTDGEYLHHRKQLKRHNPAI